FADDLRRLPTLRDWDVPVDEVRARLRPGMRLGEAIAAVYETYAARHGKSRWGDKTPMYMQRLPMLERLFPDARFVHLVRDGRDQLPPGGVAGLGEVAGALRGGLGYGAGRGSTVRGALRAASFSAGVGAWAAAGYALRRSPLWRRRHPPLA